MRKLILILSVASALLGLSLATAIAAKSHHHRKGSDPVLLGDQNVESVSDGGVNTSEAFGYTATVTGTAQTISAYLTSTHGAQVALYANNSLGQPGAQLGTGSVSSNATGWVTIPISGSASIVSGTRYWLAIASTVGHRVTYRDQGSSGSNLDWSLNGLANPASLSAQWNSNPASVYLNGTTEPPPPPVVPANTVLPAISGTAQQGQTLTASQGSWSGTTPISYTYAWSDGATGQTDTLTAADVGQNVSVTVTATNTAGSAQATSATVGPVTSPPTPVPPSNTTPPAVTGTPQQGSTLSVSNGTWSGDTPISYTYRWQDCTAGTCQDITGATSSSYTLQASDVGSTIDAVVTATNTAGQASATSAQTATVTATTSGLYQLPADRATTWNPGLNAVGGIPTSRTVYTTVSPSGGDDTAAIQSALDSCPQNAIVQLTAGTFHISGQGLAIEHSYCTLRGASPGDGNFSPSTQTTGTGTGTFLVKPAGTNYPVIIIGPRWANEPGSNPINLTSDGVKGSKTVTVASTTGLAAGTMVAVNSLTDSTISHWNSQDPENNSAWFEEANRPLGQTMEIASVSGNTITFTTPFHITQKVAQTAHLYILQNAVKYSGIENLYVYGGEGGDGGGGIHLFSCAYCWVKHIEDTWSVGAAIHVDVGFRDEIRDSYFHDSKQGLYNGGANYGIGLNWYTSDTLLENNIIIRFNKDMVMRSAGGGNVVGYNYADDGADSGGQWMETVLNSSHMTTPNYELFEGNQGANFDQDDRWGNSVYITVFRNDLIGFNRDFSQYGPLRAAGVTQWHWWQSFVGNVLGTPSHPGITRYEDINPANWGGAMWMVCWQASDNVPDGGKCQSTILRDGNFDYVTGQVHWHGIGGTGAGNGLTPPVNHTLPDSLYLSAKPSFFGSTAWPWVDGSSASNPLPGTLPARVRYDASTPNAVQ